MYQNTCADMIFLSCGNPGYNRLARVYITNNISLKIHTDMEIDRHWLNSFSAGEHYRIRTRVLMTRSFSVRKYTYNTLESNYISYLLLEKLFKSFTPIIGRP
jgi:hypothetical protein